MTEPGYKPRSDASDSKTQRQLECVAMGEPLCHSGLVSSWGTRGGCCNQPPGLPALRCPVPWAGDTPSAEKTEVAPQKHNHQHKNVSCFSAACACRWSSGTSTPRSSRPNNVAIEWGSPHQQSPWNTARSSTPSPTHHTHRKPSKEFGLHLSLCELSAPNGEEGAWGTRDDPGVQGGSVVEEREE